MLPPIKTDDCVYTAFYCEENVYKLCEQLETLSCELYAVFVSNQHKQVPFWHQKAGGTPSGLAVWDYHVLAVQRLQDGGTLVWDLDTTFPAPCEFKAYTHLVLQSQLELHSGLQRLYRVVPAHEYLHAFASDRSHMCLKDGSYQAVPPSYPCIVAKDGHQMRLHDYISMTIPELAADHTHTASTSQHLGTVHTEAAFLARFAPTSAAEANFPATVPALNTAQQTQP